LSAQRSAAFAELCLDDLREVARCHGARVNDVLLAVVAGALRDRLLRDDALPDRPLVVAVPVSAHQAESAAANAVSVMLVPLATDVADPVERLAAIRAATEQAKSTHGALGPRLLMTVADLIPPPVVQLGAVLLVDVIGPQRMPPICNLMVSNVPGPPVPLYFAGARLRALFPLGPVFPGMGLNLTAVSCEHTVGIGLVSCPAVLSDLWSIAEALPKHLAELQGLPRYDARAGDGHGTRET
jgi:WS/DGAT/MGAT family acyltransferase